MTVYVASSWRNPRYPAVIDRLRSEGIAHYDFRNPAEGNHGFSGTAVAHELGYGEDGWTHPPSALAACDMLNHRLADEYFALDHDALLCATAGLLVMPCGRSAHIELGFLIGRVLPSIVLLDESSEIELMWRLAELVTPSLDEAIAYLHECFPNTTTETTQSFAGLPERKQRFAGTPPPCSRCGGSGQTIDVAGAEYAYTTNMVTCPFCNDSGRSAPQTSTEGR